MKNLLALVGAAVVLVVGLGWYLGWYKVGVSNGTGEVKVDLNKVKADIKKEKETVGEFIKEHQNGKGVPGQSTSFSPPPGVTIELPPLPPPPTGTPTVPGTDSTIVIPPPPMPPPLQLPPPIPPGNK
jgi:hypothetical protein